MRCRTKSRRCKAPAAVRLLAGACLIAAVCLLAALPRTAALARGFIDMGRECSLTVKTEILVQDVEEENADWSELNETEIQVYLYRVADVNQYGEYESREGFDALGLETVDGSTKADDWREKAREAAAILGLPIPPRAEDADGGSTGEGSGSGTVQPGNDVQQPGDNQPGSGSQQPGDNQLGSGSQQPGNSGQPMGNPGAAGGMEPPADLPGKLSGADAVITVENGIGTAQNLAQGMYLVWVMPVYTDEYEYTFLPYLVSLPNNSYDGSIPGSADEWEYETTVGLKPRQNVRYGNLRLRKTLNNYNEALGQAMFVFRIEARKDLNHDGEKEIVYSNVLGLEFDASGSKEALIEHIPAGAEVTVEEVYSGSAYTLQGSSNIRETVIRTENGTGQQAAVDFTNDSDNRIVYGTGAINRFTNDGGGWSGSRITGKEGSVGE